MAKKLLLINPSSEAKIDTTIVSLFTLPPACLACLASLTPSDWDIEIIDEDVGTITFDNADLVGITAMTSNAPRAYEISEQYRLKGIKTVMGGVHASTLPDEAIEFTDAVVIGEAESVWQRLLYDFENNELKRFYRGQRIFPKNHLRPRHDLHCGRYRTKASVETARGCPMDCEFCSVTSFNGRTYRQRPVEEVLDELEALNCKELFFTDDNIVGYGKKAEDRAIKLFRGMIDRGLKKRWFAQAGIDIADNPVVLEYAKNSGCMGLLIGFESINDEALRSMKKVRNLKVGVGNYKELIKKIRDHGICVDAAFIFGNDEDGKDVFQRTTEFILDSKIDVEQLTILTPLPGTRLYNRLKLEGRLLRINYPDDWKHYDFMEAVFMPKHMTPLELEEGVYQVAMNITGRVTSLKRALNSVIQVKSPFSGIFAYVWNRGVHSIAARQYEYVKAQDLLRLNDSYKSHPVRYGERSKSEIGSTH